MSVLYRPARRTEAKPLVGLYAESNCGKTKSALLLARGYVGPAGRIFMIETEGGRGEAYADEIPGGYDVAPIRDSFSPQAYGERITAAERAGAQALIIDSASHEWEGVGGVLDMAGSGNGVGKWKKPKEEHHRHFMSRLQTTAIPLVIVCMRARYPMKEVQNPETRRKEWVRIETLQPKQADDILSEMFVHGWIDRDHRLHLTSWRLPALREVFHDGEPITLETGERMARWARGEPIAGPRRGRDALFADARARAEGGAEALKAWRADLDERARRALDEIADELDDIAREADDRTAPPASD